MAADGRLSQAPARPTQDWDAALQALRRAHSHQARQWRLWPNLKLAHAQTPPTQPDHLRWLFSISPTLQKICFFPAAPTAVTQPPNVLDMFRRVPWLFHFIIVVYRGTFLASALIFSSTEGLGSLPSQTTVTIRVKTQNKTHLPLAFNICLNPPLN